MNSSSTNNAAAVISSFTVDKPGRQKFAPKIGRSAQNPTVAITAEPREKELESSVEKEETGVTLPTPKPKTPAVSSSRSKTPTANNTQPSSEKVISGEPEKLTMAYFLKDRKVGIPMVNSPVPKKQKGQAKATAAKASPIPARPAPQVSRIAAPQVKIVDGKVVLDEDSMHATISPQEYLADMTIVNESHRKLTSATFAKRRVISNRWSKPETDLFYEALAMCGTDFSMIETLMPHRSRAQIKGKYKIEERSDAMRLAHTLANPKAYDATFPERVRAFLDDSNK